MMKKRLLLFIPIAAVISGCCAYGPQAKRESILETKQTEKGLEIRLKGDVTFETMSSELKEEAAQVIDDLGQEFVMSDVRSISVVGHTDNRGADAYNMRLSRDRAQSVKNHLVAQGVKANRIVTDGKGPNEPIASNDTDEGRAKNLRVEILVQE